jgi:hypothetical protein
MGRDLSAYLDSGMDGGPAERILHRARCVAAGLGAVVPGSRDTAQVEKCRDRRALHSCSSVGRAGHHFQQIALGVFTLAGFRLAPITPEKRMAILGHAAVRADHFADAEKRDYCRRIEGVGNREHAVENRRVRQRSKSAARDRRGKRAQRDLDVGELVDEKACEHAPALVTRLRLPASSLASSEVRRSPASQDRRASTGERGERRGECQSESAWIAGHGSGIRGLQIASTLACDAN